VEKTIYDINTFQSACATLQKPQLFILYRIVVLSADFTGTKDIFRDGLKELNFVYSKGLI
jgi:hypothetical protein